MKGLSANQRTRMTHFVKTILLLQIVQMKLNMVYSLLRQKKKAEVYL